MKILKICLLSITILPLIAGSVFAGTVPPDSTIFPGIMGKQLIDSLRVHYTANTNLTYAIAKDTLFAHIDCINDTLRCIYGGFKIWMDPTTTDPSQYAEARQINCEHSWPQSLGAENYPPEGDLHHLFPSYDVINSVRSSYPFREIIDSETERWYINNTYQTTKPTSNIDQYTEIDIGTTAYNGRCEIKEINKGNIARAQYYFFTIWKSQYLSIQPDSSWWMSEKDDLYQWHCIDIADQVEINRTKHIALRQENKPNPFVLDSTLIRRAYFPTLGVTGNPQTNIADKNRLFQNSPNPFKKRTIISYSLSSPGQARLEIYNLLGQSVRTIEVNKPTADRYELEWNGKDQDGRMLPPGIYFYRLSVKGKTVDLKRMIMLK